MKKPMLTTAVCFLVSSVVSSVAFAQAPAQPGPEHEGLKEMEGKWDCVMEMPGPDGKPMKSKCSATYKMINGGMWLASDFEGDIGGQKFQGHGLDGYDTHKKKFVGIWTDSMSTAPMLMEGDYDSAKKVLTMSGESIGMSGKPEKFKTTTEHKDKDHMTFKMFMIADGKENLAFTIEYTRKK